MTNATPPHQARPQAAGLRAMLAALTPLDDTARAAAAARDLQLTKPPGALGRLETLAAWLCAVQGRHPPTLERVRVVVFAGWHGVTAQGVSPYPAEVTGQMVANFAQGGAAVNQLASLAGAELRVVPLAPGRATADFSLAPAMSEDDMLDAFATGMAAVEPGLDLLAVGEMGIGNTSAAAAIMALLTGDPGARWAGPGTGLDAPGVRHKAAVIDRACALHAGCTGDPLAILAAVGGREIAAMAGAILAARRQRVPVLLDGFVCGAAAAILHAIEPTALAHCQAAHRSAEPAHRLMLERLELTALLDLGMRLGEASGAALAIPILRAAVACHTGMATFAQAGVSGKA